MNDELRHHGIKGQKWGVRRYQTKDGSLTPEGRARLKSDIDSANKAVGKAKELHSKKLKKTQEAKIKEAASRMTDEELRRVVNRLNMEERYKQVMNSRMVETGKDRTSKILDYAGKALTLGASAAALMIQMQELKNKV